ncbi:MAG: hypothetical protein EBV97_12720 [Rhodobacteraceae bacterium]|nr:hypothetical protein [Paracoccaceae bacterium]
MLKKSYDYIKMLDSKLRRAFGKDLETPSGRFWARIHYHLFDHAFLRVFWTNHKEIAPGVFRSNQPTFTHITNTKNEYVKNLVCGLKT